MTGPSAPPLPETPAVLTVRRAVRNWQRRNGSHSVTIALSGGADSLALTAAAVVEIASVRAVVVDHQLQNGSAEVADAAAARAIALGCVDAQVVAVDVDGAGGPEAAARAARYRVLREAPGPVLLGHTLDDQAETVLLGLGRGSGPRSIRGMAAHDPPWGRPLLGVRRATTRALCADLGLTPWDDPHNDDPAYTRVRLRREVLPLLEDVLSGGVAEALARTATQLRDDGEVLDALAVHALETARADNDPAALDTERLVGVAPAVRRRALRLWLLDGGAESVNEPVLRAVDDLVGRWRGQGEVAVGGHESGARLVARRRHGRLTLEAGRDS